MAKKPHSIFPLFLNQLFLKREENSPLPPPPPQIKHVHRIWNRFKWELVNKSHYVRNQSPLGHIHRPGNAFHIHKLSFDQHCLRIYLHKVHVVNSLGFVILPNFKYRYKKLSNIMLHELQINDLIFYTNITKLD